MNRKNTRCVTFFAVIALVVTSLLPVFVDAVEMTGVHDLNIALDESYEEFLPTYPVRSDYPFADHYPSVQELYEWYDDLVVEYPALVTKVNIGTSWEGRDLWIMEITSDEEQVEDKPEIVIDAAMHAREWSSVQAASYLMWRLLKEYETNETIYWLLNNRVVNIMPMQNPDGYIFDGDGVYEDRAGWRKNRNDSYLPDGIGVDLNRNWDINWAGGGSSGDPGSDVHHGEAPFSEYENRYLRDFMISRNVQSYQNIHSHHYSLLIPNMHTTDPAPHDDWLRGMASHMTSLTTLHGDPDSHYVYGQPGEVIGYSASGGAGDWAYHVMGAHAMVFELYTGGSGMAGFYPDPSLIMTINNDVDESLIYQCRVADTDLGDGTDHLFPPIPYLVYGQAEDTLGDTLVDLSVTIENTNTGEDISVDTDGNGYYEINFGNLVEEGYTLADTFSISAGTFSDTFTIGDEWGHRRDLVIPPDGETPEITIITPNGGEVWRAGTEEEITWSAVQGQDIIEYVDLFYSTDGGTSWNDIASGLNPWSGYTWTLPNEHTTTAAVLARAIDSMGRRGEDISDDHFEIIGIPPAPPENLAVEHTGTNEEWTWLYDQPHRTSPTEATALGSGGTYWSAMRVQLDGDTALGMACYVLHQPTYIRGYIHEDGIGGSSPGERIGETGQIDDPGPDEWVEMHYTDPVQLDGGHYWIVLEISLPDGATRGLGRYEGHVEDNAWISMNFDSWNELRDYGLIFNHALEVLTLEAGDGDEHNLVTWNGSPDDPDTVSYYNLYRSESQEDPWDVGKLIDSIEADGSGVYEHLDTDKGMADDIFWWYLVRAVGTNGFEEHNGDAVREPGAETETFDIQLYGGGAADGWNFVSFNIVVADTSRASILSDIDGSYDRVMHYHASRGEWLTYVPGRPEHFNNLNIWNHHQGIWIRVTEDVTLSVEGYEPIHTDITLYPGWNMVGFPSGTSMNSMDTLPGEISHLGMFDATADYNVAYVPKDQFHTISLHPGRGYWLYNGDEQSVVWRVEY